MKPKPEARQLLFWSGLDGPDTGRPMPMADVLARPEVIGLAVGLNGQQLHPDHGFPARARSRLGRSRQRQVADRDQYLDQAVLDPDAPRRRAYIGPDYRPRSTPRTTYTLA